MYSEMYRIEKHTTVHGFTSLCMNAFVSILVKEDRHSPPAQPQTLPSRKRLLGFSCHLPNHLIALIVISLLKAMFILRQMHRGRHLVLGLHVWTCLWSPEVCATFSQVLRAIWKSFEIIGAISFYLFLPALIGMTHREVHALNILKRHTRLFRYFSRSKNFGSQHYRNRRSVLCLRLVSMIYRLWEKQW